MKTYEASWSEKKKKLVAAAAKAALAKPKAKSKAKAKGAGKGGGGPPMRDLPDGDLVQAQLRPLVPPGGHIWRANLAGAWCSHFAPFPRFSCSWHLYGHREAAVLVLRDLWTKYLTFHGLEMSQCSIRGLFDLVFFRLLRDPGELG